MKCVVIEIENFTRQQLAGFVLIVGFPDSIVLSYFIRLSCSLPKLNPTKANLMNRFFSLLTIVFMTVTATAHAQISFGLPDGFAQSLVENPWDGSFAAGLNGKAGNSQNLDINLTLNLARETDVAKTTVLASYFYSANAISTVTDRFFGQARQERSFANRPKLSAFAQGQYEWDRFKAFDYRLALHGGLGYEVYKLDDRFLKVRFGAGASREFGAVDAEWLPELQFGADWERQVTETLKLFANLDFYPNVSDFSDFRFVTNAGLEFVVDAERNINFRMFVLDRYDSTPVAGDRENDIDYGLALVFGF